jgi:hypothetical protein
VIYAEQNRLQEVAGFFLRGAKTRVAAGCDRIRMSVFCIDLNDRKWRESEVGEVRFKDERRVFPPRRTQLSASAFNFSAWMGWTDRRRRIWN